MTSPRDRPGPHPENQRKRTELRGPRQALIGVLAIAAVLALVALFGFGSALPRSGILLVLIAATQAVAAGLLVRHHVRARMVALAAALVALAWGVLHVLVLDEVTWLQLALMGTGTLEAFLVAGCTPRDTGKKRMSRRGRR